MKPFDLISVERVAHSGHYNLTALVKKAGQDCWFNTISYYGYYAEEYDSIQDMIKHMKEMYLERMEDEKLFFVWDDDERVIFD